MSTGRKQHSGHRIRRRRQQLDMTQGEFGEKLGIKQAAVSLIELRGVQSLEHLERIAKVLQCRAAWLAFGEKPVE